MDTRTTGKTEEYVFDGLAADVYLQCDAAKTIRELVDHTHVTEYEVTSILNRFVSQGLMIHSGRQYLSLAVVRDGKTTVLSASNEQGPLLGDIPHTLNITPIFSFSAPIV